MSNVFGENYCSLKDLWEQKQQTLHFPPSHLFQSIRQENYNVCNISGKLVILPKQQEKDAL